MRLTSSLLWVGKTTRTSAPMLLFATSLPAGALLMNLAAARVLPQDEFGGFAITWATVQAFSAVGQASLAFAATRFVAQFAVREAARASAALRSCVKWSAWTGGAVALALAAGAGIVASTAMDRPDLEAVVRVSAVLSFAVITSSVLSAGLLGTAVPSANYTLAALQLAGPVAGVYLGAAAAGVSGAILGLAAVYALRGLVAWWLLRFWEASVGVSPGSAVANRDELLGFATPSVVAGVVSPTAQWLALSMLAGSGAGLDAVALFAVASNVRNLAVFPAGVLWQAFGVLINRAVGERQLRAAVLLTASNFLLVICAVGLSAGVVMLFGDSLLGVFGTEYHAATSILSLLLVAGLLDAAAGAVYQLVVAAGDMWRSLVWIVLPRDAVLIVVAIGFTSAGDAAVGLATAHVGAAVLNFVATCALAVRSWRRLRTAAPGAAQ